MGSQIVGDNWATKHGAHSLLEDNCCRYYGLKAVKWLLILKRSKWLHTSSLFPDLTNVDTNCAGFIGTLYSLVDCQWISFRDGSGTPLQYSCLENPMDGGAWWAAVHGVPTSRTPLGHFPFTFHFHPLEKEMETHSSVLAWRIPGTGEPGGLPSMGSHRVGHD